MLAALKTFSDRLLGRGAAALTVPPLDGALRPDNRLEDAPPGLTAKAPDTLILLRGRPAWSEGARLMSEAGEISVFASAITAMAVAADDRLAVATADGAIAIDGVVPPSLKDIACVTALAFAQDASLWIAIGSSDNPVHEWPRDLLELRRSGRLLRYEPRTGAVSLVADRLGFPNALLATTQGMIVSEAWTHRIMRYEASGRATPLVSDLPGYPAGLARSDAGGYWLAVFAPRSPLIELVLREPSYRRAMMRDVDPRYWIAPALSSGQSFLEPMQGGALKQMGLLKPWAPTRSYGLVIEFGADFTPIQSLHSRAGGRRHGLTSVLEHEGMLWLAAKGGDEVLRLPMGDLR